MIQVRVRCERHGNAGKVSNLAKTTVHQDFIEFVDINTQPNGRSADSSGPTSYFLPKFSWKFFLKFIVLHNAIFNHCDYAKTFLK